MRILFLSPVHPLLTPASAKASAGKSGFPLPRWQMQMSWVRGLERQGHRVRVVKYTPDDKIRLNLVERIWWNFRVIRNTQKARLPRSAKSGPRNDGEQINLIILSLGADVLLAQTLKFIKWLTGAPLVILSGVSPVSDGNPRDREIAKLADLAAVNDEGHAREWRKLGAKKAVVLPISGVDPELHWKREEGKKIVKKKKDEEKRGRRSFADIDVLFVGTLTPERKRFLGGLKRLLPDAVKFVVKEFVWEEEYARLMSRAKIVLNPIRPEMKNGANLRMFEIPAFGALELASSGKKEWLTPGKEMLVYKDVKEAAGLIKRYLKDGKRREEMVKRGKRRVERKHTFEKRAERLMKMIINKRINE